VHGAGRQGRAPSPFAKSSIFLRKILFFGLTLLLCNEMIWWLAHRKTGGGSIVNIVSIWWIIGAPGVESYQANKGAVTLLTKNAAVNFAPTVRVNSIHPDLILTPNGKTWRSLNLLLI
jgi:NAD(P)-dependent dehydrogenase (short-subunit alcohol dehydrogenase family)